MIKTILLNSILLLSVFLFFTCNAQIKTGDSLIEGPKMFKKQGTYSYMTHTGPHTDTLVSISSIFEDAKGNVWVTTTGEGVYCYDGNTFTNFTTDNGLITNDVYCTIQDREGNLWFGTTNGVSRYDGKDFTNFPFSFIHGDSPTLVDKIEVPSLHTEVWSMLQDKKGKIWLGTTNGIYHYDGTSFTEKSGIPSIRAVPEIIEDNNGNLWFTSWSEGLCRFDGKLITFFKTEGLLSNDLLLQAKNGDVWIGNRGNGVYRYNGNAFEKVFVEKAITEMKEDSNGNIWFSTFDRKNKSREVILYNPSTNKIIHSMSQAEFGDQMITCIEIDKLGNVWFGTNKMTLFKYDGKIFTKFSSE